MLTSSNTVGLAKARTVDDKTRQALRKLGRNESVVSRLLTPPLGVINLNVEKARRDIVKLLIELGGEDLKNYDGHWVVNIYSKDSVNAWVKSLRNEERSWNDHSTGMTLSYREALSIPNDGKPIYEFGFTTDLLSFLENKDQLAFVVGHELTHLLEGHIEGERVNSQQHELVADSKAVLRMVGKYVLDQAALALDKLYCRGDDSTHTAKKALSDIISSGLSTHHHEGQRISAIQFLAEKFNRSNTEAQALKAATPLPAYFRDLTKDRTKLGPDKEFHFLVAYYREYLKKVWLTDLRYQSLEQSELRRLGVENPGKYSSPTAEQQRDFLDLVLKDIESSGVSKSDQVNAFLLLVIEAQSGQKGHLNFSELDPLRIRAIKKFFLRNSTGENAWTLESLIKSESPILPRERLELNKMFLHKKEGESILQDMMKFSSQWVAFSKYLYSGARLYDGRGRPVHHDIESEIRRLLRKQGPLADQQLTGWVETIRMLQWPDLTDRGYFLNQLQSIESDRVRPIVDVLVQQGSSVGQMQIDQLLRESRGQSFHERMTQLDGLARNAKREEYSEESLSKLRNVILEWSAQPEILQGQVNPFFRLTTLAASQLLADTKIPWKDRQKVFEMLTLHQSVVGNYSDRFQSEITQNILAFMNGLSREEVFKLLLSRPAVLGDWLRMYSELPKKFKSVTGDLNEVYDFIQKETGEYTKLLQMDDMLGNVRVNALRLFNLEAANQRFFESASQSELETVLQAFESSIADIKAIKDVQSFSLNPFSNGTTQKDQIKLISHRDSNSAIVAMFVSSLKSNPSLRQFRSTMERVYSVTNRLFSYTHQQRLTISEYLVRNFEKMHNAEKLIVVRTPELAPFLETKVIAGVFFEKVKLLMNWDRSINKLKSYVEDVVRDEKLLEKPELYEHFRNLIAEHWNLQPHTIDRVFPADSRSITQKTKSANKHVRGLSALLTATRNRSLEAQLAFVDYMMGRADRPPAFVFEVENDLNKKQSVSGYSFISHIMEARDNLQVRSELERAAFVNSFLTGPTGLVHDERGLNFVTEKILSLVSEPNRDFARLMMKALIKAEGPKRSVILSYILAQQSGAAQLTEAHIFKSFIDAYGVPGVKLAQYLSFTNEFKSFGPMLESYQDAAMPINYFEMIELVKTRMGSRWDPGRYRVVKLIGSGSVNVAVEIENLVTGGHEVLNISRQDIETKTAEDFHRFDLLLQMLSEDPTQGKKFEFVTGLMRIIRDSVTLEFDKRHAFEIQKEVQALYNRDINGWKVRTVDAYEFDGMTIRMQKAPGIGARHVLAQDPASYRGAMSALLAVEDSILRGLDEKSRATPIALHANPDLHDGQVLIDVRTKTVTILDFGQALRISNDERLLAIEMLRFVSGIDSARAAKRTLETRFRTLGLAGLTGLSESFFTDILSRTDRMDRFVRLASGLNQRGYKLPLSSVHWVLAANRAAKLGAKVGIPIERSYRNLLLADKVGISLGTYNHAAGFVRGVPEAKGRSRSGVDFCSKVFGVR